MKRVLVVAVALVFVLSALAFAANNPAAKVAVHVKVHNAKQACTNLPVIAGCADIATTYPGFSVDAFPVFFDLTEYLGLEYAMCWPAWQYSAAYTSCSPLKIGGIVWPGDGISQTWTACQPGPVALPGWAWLYADYAGMVCVCGHPQHGEIKILDCADGINNPVCNFCAGVYGVDGDDPCEPTSTEQSTWGGIKAVFK